MNDKTQPATGNDFRPTPEEARTAFARSGRRIIVLSAFIIALKLAEVKIDKVSLAGADFSVQQPFVVVGTLGLILVYFSVRYVAQLVAIMVMLLDLHRSAGSKPQHPKRPLEWLMMGFLQLLVGLSTAFEFSLFVVAIYLAWPDVRLLASLMAEKSSEHDGIALIAAIAFGYALIAAIVGFAAILVSAIRAPNRPRI